MTNSRVHWFAVAASVALLATLTTMLTGAGAADGQTPQVSRAAHRPVSPQARRLHRILHPAKKYYGIYVSRSPGDLGPLNAVAAETGKHPNLSLYYEDWGSGAASGQVNFDHAATEHACHAGMLPMLTWESWDTADTGPNGVAVTQPAFAPAKIARGKYDAYIRATARAMKATSCPIAVRFDQEVNSNWYPWGVATPGMHNSPHSYVAMWRHVRRIFRSVHATNVLWVWSPNIQSRAHPGLPALRKSYPGNHYVNWVGIDGYFYHHPNETFHGLFGPTITQLSRFAARKPWIIAECGVGSGPSKPRQIASLLAGVAHSKRFDGVNYFDTNKPWNRSDWALDETSASLRAFRKGINRSAYAASRS
jgi:hypothetical protein